MSQTATRQTRLESGIAALGLSLPEPAVSQLMAYLALLERWNTAYNLTAVRDPDEMIVRHVLDSLAILPFVRGRNLADLGTGAGFPGLVLAIASPEREVLLVDSNGKKVRFLREVIRRLKLAHVHAEQQRVEALKGQFDCITARAFASLADMLAWGGHLLAEDGLWLAMKGQLAEDELSKLPATFVMRSIHELHVPGLPAERHLLELIHASAAH